MARARPGRSRARSRRGSRTARCATLALRLERGVRQRARARRAARRARRRDGRALPGPARRPGPRGGQAPDARLRHGRLVRRSARASAPSASSPRAELVDGGDQLRRRPHDRRAARALGRRRRARGLHPLSAPAARTPPTCWPTSSGRWTLGRPTVARDRIA